MSKVAIICQYCLSCSVAPILNLYGTVFLLRNKTLTTFIMARLIIQLGLGSFIFFIAGCETIKQSSKYQFTEGYYRIRLQNRPEKVYVLNGSDSIKVYKEKDLKMSRIDSTKAITIAFPSTQKPAQFESHQFRRNTFDLDVLSVLFKYRPSVRDFPPQFNATFNGAIYIGYRIDAYKLSYTATPLHIFKRTITHYGYSFGLFTGFGTARIDEFDTNNSISIEYDGLVNLSGFAAILAVDKLSFGLTLGADHLLDKNKKVWVNNGKPWIGLSIGLNLN